MIKKFVTKLLITVIAIILGFGVFQGVVKAQSQSEFDLVNAEQLEDIVINSYRNISAVNAWRFINNFGAGFDLVTVGMIDTGVEVLHQEFRDVRLGSDVLEDPASHGTDVAGIIGADNKSFDEPYNTPEMNGVLSGFQNSEYRIIAKSFSTLESSEGDEFGLIAGIEEMVTENDIEVFNGSFGVPLCDALTPDQLDELIDTDKRECYEFKSQFNEEKENFRDVFNSNDQVTFVFAAGNENISSSSTLPAGATTTNVVVIGATDLDDTRSIWEEDVQESNFGAWVDLAAPGNHVYAPATSTQSQDLYDKVEIQNGEVVGGFSGTSASAPQVSGVAGILKSLEQEYQNTTPFLEMNPETIRQTLVASADPIDTGEPNKPLGEGCFKFDPNQHTGCRLNAHRAVAWHFPPAPVENLDAQVVSNPSSLSLFSTPSEPDMSEGMKDKTDTVFKFKNSDYPDLTLETSKTLHLTYMSHGDTITYKNLESGATSTAQFTIKNFKPNTAFTLRIDGQQQQVQTDSDGSVSFSHDVSGAHSVWITIGSGSLTITSDTTLTSDVSGPVFIDGDNITLDCSGHSITPGQSFVGVQVLGDNNTVENCTIDGFIIGLENFGGTGLTLENNTVLNHFTGASLGGNNTVMLGNDFQQGTGGFPENLGVTFQNSGGHILQNNTFTGQTSAIEFIRPHSFPFAIPPSSIDSSNTVNGDPVEYLVGADNVTITNADQFGYLGIENSSNITIENTPLPSGNREAVFVSSSTDLTFDNVSGSASEGEALELFNTDNVDVLQSSLTGSGQGVLSSGDNYDILNSNLDSNGDSLDIRGDNYSIEGNSMDSGSIRASISNSEIRDNFIADTTPGLNAASFFGGSNLIFENNTFTNPGSLDAVNGFTDTGLSLSGTDDVLVFHNNFLENVIQADASGSNIEFDNGPAEGGNFWENFTCPDIDSDGFCDDPFVVNATQNIQDNFPFTIQDGWLGPQTKDIELTWDVPSDFATTTPDFVEFKVLRDTQSINSFDSNLVIETITDPSTESFIDQDREVGTTFHYRIFTEDGAGLKEGSNETTITP